MPYGQSHYLLLPVQVTKLEQVLNEIEEMASGHYDIISVFQQSQVVVNVLVRFAIVDEDPVFDEAEIRRKLGFDL